MTAWRITHFNEVESTNAVALDLIKRGSEAFSDLAGTVFLADRQSAGRGQHGRSWASPTGGLYMTAILGDLPIELRPLAALLTGVAVAEAMEHEGIGNVGLRWPNDVVIGGKKVAGILCEGVAIGPQWICVVGIGVNVNVPLTALPAELASRATTLFACDGKTRDIPALADAILTRIAIAMSSTPQQLVDAIRQRDVLRGNQVIVSQADGVISGIAIGIDSEGALRIATENCERNVTTGSIISVAGISIR